MCTRSCRIEDRRACAHSQRAVFYMMCTLSLTPKTTPSPAFPLDVFYDCCALPPRAPARPQSRSTGGKDGDWGARRRHAAMPLAACGDALAILQPGSTRGRAAAAAAAAGESGGGGGERRRRRRRRRRRWRLLPPGFPGDVGACASRHTCPKLRGHASCPLRGSAAAAAAAAASPRFPRGSRRMCACMCECECRGGVGREGGGEVGGEVGTRAPTNDFLQFSLVNPLG